LTPDSVKVGSFASNNAGSSYLPSRSAAPAAPGGSPVGKEPAPPSPAATSTPKTRQTAAPNSSTIPAAVTASERQQVANRPLIRKLLELTGGNLVDVRKRETPLEVATGEPVPEGVVAGEVIEEIPEADDSD
jgi:hypothetical protein